MSEENTEDSTESTEDTSSDTEQTDDTAAGSTEDTTSSDSGSGSTSDWEKEAARLRSELVKARKWEKQAKANADAAKRLGELEEVQKTAEQKAQDAAKRAEERASAANQRVARAEVKAALTGVVDDPESIIEDLHLKKFLDDDGNPDEEAIAALRAKYVAIAPPSKRAPNPNPAQGANGSKEHQKPLTEADLAHMSTEEINKARHDGSLDHLMGRKTPRK